MNTKNKASRFMKPISILMTIAVAIALMAVPHDVSRSYSSLPMQSSGADSVVTVDARVPVASKDVRAMALRDSGTGTADVVVQEYIDEQFDQVATGNAAAFVGPQQFADKQHAVQPDETEGNPAVFSPRSKMSGPVAALLAAGATGDAELVVRYDERPELFDDELVAKLGGEVIRSYQHLDMRAIRLPVESLESLASDSNVDWLSLDDTMSATSVSSRLAANVPGADSMNSAYSGLNVGVAVLDTGVSSHADLSEQIVQYSFLGGQYPTPSVLNGQIVALNGGPRFDGFGHGTHVAGVLSGSGKNSNGSYKGSAKRAKILSLQVLDADGSGSMSDVMAALDWLLTYGEHFDVRVVNLSLGKGISESNQTDPLVLAVERLWDAGIVVVVAAGNDGYSGSMTVNSPANSRKVITVGSLTDNATGLDHSDDYVSSFSSQGPTIGDYVLKPDLLAPGNRVVGAVSSNSLLATLLTGRVKSCLLILCSGGVYLEMSGTSMAAPLVSAAAALMLEKDPSLSPATVKARLMRSAHKLDVDPTEGGAGLLNVEAALDDSGMVAGDALSPLMIFDTTNNTVLVEDTAELWGDPIWGAAHLFNSGINWSSGASFTDANGVTANGYMWTDGGVSAKGYMWTDGGVSAKGYMWTDGVNAKSLLESDGTSGFIINDDEPAN